MNVSEYLYVDENIKKYVFVGTVGELRELIKERKEVIHV